MSWALTILDIVMAVGILWLLRAAFGDGSVPPESSIALYLAILAIIRLRDKGERA